MPRKVMPAADETTLRCGECGSAFWCLYEVQALVFDKVTMQGSSKTIHRVRCGTCDSSALDQVHAAQHGGD